MIHQRLYSILATGLISILFSCKEKAGTPIPTLDCVCACNTTAQNTLPTVASFSPKASVTITLKERTSKPLLVANMPWESSGINYSTVLKIDGKWKMWYESFDDQSDQGMINITYLCFAESSDGINWTKPILNKIKYGGNTKNNIVLIHSLPGTSVFYDEVAPDAMKYKMIFIKPNEIDANWVYGMSSPDGINFANEVLIEKTYSDTQTGMIHEQGKYRMYSRLWDGVFIGAGRRTIAYSESETFGGTCFPAPTQILALNDVDRDLYNNAISKLQEGLYVMFPSVFIHNQDNVIPYVASSNDGINFTFRGTGEFLPLGKGFDSRCIYVGPGAVPGESEGEYIFYYTGKSFGHSVEINDVKGSYTGGIGRFVVKIH